MFNKIKEIKQKIKFAKIWVIIVWLLFIALIINSIYLTCKVIELDRKVKYNDFTNNKFDNQINKTRDFRR